MRRGSVRRTEGQALIEFALVLPLFLIVVVGLVQFGRAITYWLDLNDSAQVSVRYAVTNRFPGCTSALDSAKCTPGSLTGFTSYATSNLNSGGLRSTTVVGICFVDTNGSGAPSIGEPVSVNMSSPFNIAGLFNFALNLRGRATMRMEQTISSTNPTRIGPIPTC